jgi:hypothetical protein
MNIIKCWAGAKIQFNDTESTILVQCIIFGPTARSAIPFQRPNKKQTKPAHFGKKVDNQGVVRSVVLS